MPDIVIYDTRTWRPRARLETPGHLVLSVAFTPDGSRLVATANRSDPVVLGGVPEQHGSIWTWHTADLTPAGGRDLSEVALSEVQVSPDGKWIAAAADNRRVELFRAADLSPAGDIAAHPAEVDRLAYSPDGRLLATASASDIDVPRLWDAATGKLVAELRGHGNRVTALRFSPDGRTLATAAGRLDGRLVAHRRGGRGTQAVRGRGAGRTRRQRGARAVPRVLTARRSNGAAR